MSHTGSVIHPNQSPGLIRMITLGFAFTKDNDLLFAVPPEKPDRLFDVSSSAIERMDDQEEKGKQEESLTAARERGWVECARERFVIFLNSNSSYSYGDPVRFNLQLFDRGKWASIINKNQLSALKKAIPSEWRSKFEGEFQFKYIATEVRRLPKKFVLYPLYRFIGDLDRNTADQVLMKLRNLIDEGEFLIHPKRKITIGKYHKRYPVRSVRIMDYDIFNNEYQEKKRSYIEKDYSDHLNVEQEIKDLGQHLISSKTEIPTWYTEKQKSRILRKARINWKHKFRLFSLRR